MGSSSVSSVYVQVVDDVISNVREEFANSGVNESVLSELQALWEMKMMQCGAISGTTERPSIPKHPGGGPITPVHDLNVPYEGPIEEYETPTADMLFPPTPIQTPMTGQTPLPGTVQTPLPGMVQSPLLGIGDHSMYNFPTGPAEFAPGNPIDMKLGRPSPYMQPPSSWMNQRPLGVDVNVAYVEGREEVDRGLPHHQPMPPMQDFFMMSSGKRKRDDYASQLASGSYIPQQDGSGDVTIEFLLPETTQVQITSTRGNKETVTAGSLFGKNASAFPCLPQLDGVHDEYDNLFHFQGVAHEDYNSPADHVELRVGTPSVSTPKPAKTEAVDDDEPPLNEDDDYEEDLDELVREGEEPNTQHLVLAQFEKVTRTKSRWKCALRCGIMHLNCKDILFNKANGEFDF